MTLAVYEDQFDSILQGYHREHPYDSDAYVNYVRLNKSRIARWNKKVEMLPELMDMVKSIDSNQKWVLITEPWCGDAAHSHTAIMNLVSANSLIDLEIRNRDKEGSEIEKYLTEGARSIPILVVRDGDGNDLFSWGPRPKEAQEMVMRHKTETNRSSQEKQMELQTWYNKDKGQSIQKELLDLFKSSIPTTS